MSLVVVGSVAYDSIETPHGRRDDMLGGSGTFFSLAASAFTKPSVVAVVGEDFRADDVALLDAHGVDLSGLVRAPGRTFRWGGRYHEDMNGRDTLFTELNVFETFAPQLSATQREASFLFLGNILPKLQDHVLEQVRAPRFVAADTMNLWISTAKADLCEVLRRVDALFVNDEEARQLTGKRSVVLAAKDIQALGPSLVIIKRGEHGAIVFNEDDVFYVPAYPLEKVVDPTGAGDTFAGAFVGYLDATGDLSPENIRKAAVVGSLMASFCVEGYGVDRLRHIDRVSIRERFQAFTELTRFGALDL
ncbi:MAG: sugar kinase [Deltaproteobacteria bacterium]|jgi:sugar/nucleoside kinase (ribokinase family)|nr:sugar kinase [Deltaproteobacteria bacterium]